MWLNRRSSSILRDYERAAVAHVRELGTLCLLQHTQRLTVTTVSDCFAGGVLVFYNSTSNACANTAERERRCCQSVVAVPSLLNVLVRGPSRHRPPSSTELDEDRCIEDYMKPSKNANFARNRLR